MRQHREEKRKRQKKQQETNRKRERKRKKEEQKNIEDNRNGTEIRTSIIDKNSPQVKVINEKHKWMEFPNVQTIKPSNTQSIRRVRDKIKKD